MRQSGWKENQSSYSKIKALHSFCYSVKKYTRLTSNIFFITLKIVNL